MLKKYIYMAMIALLSLGAMSCGDDDEPAINTKSTSGLGDRIVVADFVKLYGNADVSGTIQELIDNNPGSTLYFPDGTYSLGSPLVLPASPDKAVNLELANYAVLKARYGFDKSKALICVGGSSPAQGESHYTIHGGRIDGANCTTAISISGGGNPEISDMLIYNSTVALHILPGAPGGKSNANIHGVNVIGNRAYESRGIVAESGGNTFGNMRINLVHDGVVVKSDNNHFSNIHPFYVGVNLFGNDRVTQQEAETNPVGFRIEGKDNVLEYCYSDNYPTAFSDSGTNSEYNNIFAYWYDNALYKYIGFHCDGAFNAKITNASIAFPAPIRENQPHILLESDGTGNGYFANLYIDNEQYLDNHDYAKFVKF